MPKTNADGTTAARFQVNHDLDGPAIKDEGGPLAARNASDSNYAIMRGATPVAANDLTTKGYVDGGASGITAAAHKTLLQLIHFIDEGPAEGFTTGATKTTTGTVFPSQNLWRRADATKLVEQNITWTGINPTTVEWKVYDADGSTVLATVTDTITYSGPFEASRSRAIA